MRKSKKLFLYFGLPLLAFMIFISIIFHVIHTMWYITIALVFLVAIYRKDRKFIALTKVGLVMFLWFVFLCWNPIYWPDQIYRRMNKGSLITPNAQCIADLNATWYGSSKYNGPYDRSNITGQIQELTDLQLFLYDGDFPNGSPRGYIQYMYDFFQYPGIFDHVATPEEVLVNSPYPGKDDCDGIAVVTVSLLVRLGYDAYVGESDSHWYSVVKLPGDLNSSARGETHTFVYLNWWPEVGYPYMIFNQTAVIITQPFYISWWDQLTDPYYVEIIQDYALNPNNKPNIQPLLEMPIFIAILPVALFLLGSIFSLSVGFPRKYEKKRMHLANSVLASIVITAVLLLIVFLPETVLMYGNFILLGGLGTLAFVVERDYLTKWIWKLEK